MSDQTKNNVAERRLLGRPFPPGRSGNPKGRPKGSSNVADVLLELLNRKISVRGSKKRMDTASAIIRHQYIKAMQGNKAAQRLIFDFREKLGGGNDVTAEEREKRSLLIPRSSTRDEFDFQIAPARERERQFCTAILDRENPTVREVPANILSGDEHLNNGRHEAALDDYAKQALLSKKILAETPEDKTAKGNFGRAIARIGLLADRLLRTGEYEAAARCVGRALKEDTVTDLAWIRLVGAHADMFLRKTDKAREFYCHFKSNPRHVVSHWETVILRDFADFRKLGRSVPLMAEIEVRLMEAGWRTTLGHVAPARSPGSKMTDAEEKYVMLNPHDLETAAIFAKYEQLDKAAAVYRHLLAKHRSELAKDPNQSGARETLALVETHFGRFAKECLLAGRFRTALECVNELPADRLPLQAIRAHALMLLEQTGDAKDIYLRHRGQSIEGKAWESAILDDFGQLMRKNYTSPLMSMIRIEFDRLISKTWLQAASQTTENNQLSRQSQMSSVSEPALSERADIHSAQQLLNQGELVAALGVYRRCMKAIAPRFDHGIETGQQRADRQCIVDGLSEIAFRFLFKQDRKTALEIADEALAILSNAYWPALRRAHALMLLDRADEARPIYEMHVAGKATPERTKADVIQDEFSVMRQANLAHPLMAEIEALLSPAPSLSRIIR